MSFSKQLKRLRVEHQLSQEALANKIGVSRQAVTKWESDNGIPDLGNLMALAQLFDITLDELVTDQPVTPVHQYESTTTYDIGEEKRFDLNLGTAKTVTFTSYAGEQIKIQLQSDDIITLNKDVKVKIDDTKRSLDVDIKHSNQITEARLKESLVIKIYVPNNYLNDVEINVKTHRLNINDIECEHIEFNGRVDDIRINDVNATLEIDCQLDMEIYVNGFNGSLEINQINATSHLYVTSDFNFKTIVKGIGNHIIFMRDEDIIESFSDDTSDTIVELNGLKNELIITR